MRIHKQFISALLVCLLASFVINNTLAADNEKIKTIATSCMACHGVENMKLDPQFTTPRLGRQKARYILTALKAYKSGARFSAIMQPLVSGLSEADMRDLARYMGDNQQDGEAFKAALRNLPVTSAEVVPAKVVEVCGSCHGETGGGDIPELPVLAGQYADYLEYALQQYKAGKRKGSPMLPFAAKLTRAEITQLAKYFSGQTLVPFALKTAMIPGLLSQSTNEVENPGNSKITATEMISFIAMADIPSGEFDMGDDQSAGFMVGSPRHKVKINAFRMGKYEVTFEQYDSFAKDTKRPLPSDEGWGRTNRPVINISRDDTLAFIAWLKKKSRRNFRLPSEAEWEYATRAGSTSVYWWGDEFKPDNVNAYGINGNDKWLNTAPVGQFEANAFGLYDVAGNVWERVADCWHTTYAGAPSEGRAWDSKPCLSHVIRGGSWNIFKRSLRSSGRASTPDQMQSMSIGFRLAEDIRTPQATGLATQCKLCSHRYLSPFGISPAAPSPKPFPA
jgi:formylglycine-generating enzyme required for sulfatase activity